MAKPVILLLQAPSLKCSFDTNYKLKKCMKYCKDHDLFIVMEVLVTGSNDPERIIQLLEPCITEYCIKDIVLYKADDVVNSIEQFHTSLEYNYKRKMYLHFVYNRTIFIGEKFITSEQPLTNNAKQAIIDLIKLMNLQTCPRSIIVSFINTHFKSIADLLSILQTHVLWVSIMLDKINKQSHRSQYKRKISSMTRYRKLVRRIATMGKIDDTMIDICCDSLRRITI
ncbi:Conserved non-functional serine recombinase [Sea otter poxvirus]|uniref:Protein OPG061 n=1 Tax=Sea otter poxvirus TaxID=1416741 RepID=A0A2U9QHI9_9POXV|nr:Conserved non-functional serine recombinase [Sea otter poxvirus]AWU47068.1 Conserved non-functional serine recombinase [Sea otter poxvirus]